MSHCFSFSECIRRGRKILPNFHVFRFKGLGWLLISQSVETFYFMIILSRNAAAATRQALKNFLNFTASKIFNSGISPINRQIAFLATISLYKSDTIFRMLPVLNQSVEPVLRSRYARYANLNRQLKLQIRIAN